VYSLIFVDRLKFKEKKREDESPAFSFGEKKNILRIMIEKSKVEDLVDFFNFNFSDVGTKGTNADSTGIYFYAFGMPALLCDDDLGLYKEAVSRSWKILKTWSYKNHEDSESRGEFSRRIRQDRNIALTAVRQCGDALEYVDDYIITNLMVREALKTCKSLYPICLMLDRVNDSETYKGLVKTYLRNIKNELYVGVYFMYDDYDHHTNELQDYLDVVVNSSFGWSVRKDKYICTKASWDTFNKCTFFGMIRNRDGYYIDSNDRFYKKFLLKLKSFDSLEFLLDKDIIGLTKAILDVDPYFFLRELWKTINGTEKYKSLREYVFCQFVPCKVFLGFIDRTDLSKEDYKVILNSPDSSNNLVHNIRIIDDMIKNNIDLMASVIKREGYSRPSKYPYGWDSTRPLTIINQIYEKDPKNFNKYRHASRR
jgi:hypothetical protein